MEEKETVKLDFGAIDFTPAWARNDAGVKVGKVTPVEGERKERSLGREGGERKMQERKPFAQKSFERKPFDRKGKGFDRKPRQFEERPKPLDAEVKVLPESKALGTIFRKLQGDSHAFKLKELAYFFLDNPSSVLLKVTPKDEGMKFCQCKACGFASTSDADVVEHIVNEHMADYFDAKEIEVEPPKGNFNCVAKCGLSGVLLGPPNIHEFNTVVKEMLRTKFPTMSEQEYRSRIEMVRDSESIEAWRQSATKKMVYFAKGAEDGAVPLSREQAEGEMRRTFMPALVDHPKNLMITADQAVKSPVKPLVWAVNDALQAERRSPYSMMFALRGAFHHRKMSFFRANDAKGPEFVLGHELKEFDAEHAIPELKTTAEFLVAHPCLDKSEFPAEGDFAKHLEWLVNTGHAVAFTNGVYSAVEKFPKYGPQWKKRKGEEKVKEEDQGQVDEVKVKEEGQGQGEEVKVEGGVQ